MSNQIDLSLMEPVLEKYRGQGDALIGMLQDVQETYSYLPEEALTYLSDSAKIPMSRIYAVATFYAQFYLTPRGRNTVRVCRGTACHVRGGSRILEAVERELGIAEGETTPDLEYSLETVACIGACALAPTMVINRSTHGKLTPGKVVDIFNQRKKKEQESE
jgi:NADH-quinone oxidoreductase subunit E